jgi:hypothetical protein
MDTDLLGRELEPSEARLLAVYAELKALCAQPELAPVARANLQAALAAVATAVSGLGLDYEHLIDLGV